MDKSRDRDKQGKTVLCLRKLNYVQNSDMSYKLTHDNKGCTELHWGAVDLSLQESKNAVIEMIKRIMLWDPSYNILNAIDGIGEDTTIKPILQRQLGNPNGEEEDEDMHETRKKRKFSKQPGLKQMEEENPLFQNEQMDQVTDGQQEWREFGNQN